MRQLKLLASLFTCAFVILAFGLPLAAKGAIFEVIHPCFNRPAEKIYFNLLLPENVGKISVELLKSHHIPFQATPEEMASIFNISTADAPTEALGEGRFRKRGWCFQVDDRGSALSMGQFTFIPEQHSKIRWFYGFSESLKGKLVKVCEPLYLHPDDFLCSY